MIKLKHIGSYLFFTFLILTVWLMLPSSLHAQQEYTVSGVVQDTGGRGIDGVAIAFFDGEVTNIVLTSTGGLYSYTVGFGWTGTVTPQDNCYSFAPASVSIGPVTANIDQNFTGTLYSFTISGVVTDGVNPIFGAVITLSTGEGTISGPDGSYSLTVPCGWGGTVTPTKIGWEFSPPSNYYEWIDDDYTGQNFVGTASSTTFTISGQVTDARGGGGLDGVEIEFYNGISIHTETTAGGGFYSYEVPEFWAGTVTPNLMGYTFTPNFVTVPPVQENVTYNFIGEFNNYTISGVITDDNLNPLAGVTLTLSTGGSDITGADGTYSFTLAHGWSGTLTPSRAGWVFEPRRRTYNGLMSDQPNQNYVGYQGSGRVTISGAVKQSNGTGIPGVTLTFTPGNETATSDDNGEYSKLVLSGWSGTVTPSKADYTFSPTSRTYSDIRTDQPDQDYIDYSAGGGLPVISLSPVQLNFATDASGNASGAQSFLVSNIGAGTLNWTISPDQTWITASPLSGTDSGYVTVEVDPSGKSAGTYNGTITVSDPNAVNSPQTVKVQLEVYSSTSPPFGDFATPLDGSLVRSSVPFTGWALDDLKVASVKIYLKENGSLAYIGDAVFVEGARPDVELYYPDYPNNNRAGWGYMMLTYFLPNGGNGSYTFCAIATDVEGNETTLDTRTVTVDNANAVKPFGAIDFPTQGGEASGSSFKNSGWVLTPMPNKVPEDGSTINVYVDGVYLGHPTYNIYREDVAALFPGYANSNGAHAYFDFDTTTYTNGVHTIYWTATDDAGNTDGIGSRFFTIQNPDSSSEAKSKANSISGGTPMPPLPGLGIYRLANIPVKNFQPLRVIKGVDSLQEQQNLYPDKNGLIRFEIKPGERIEIHLGKPMAGYLLGGNDYRPLPFGSTLDLGKGVFYWLPAPGYYGTYRLVFALSGPDNQITRKDIVVKIR
ncbi:MAG: hypothetical protein PVH61_43855 [Candidatus Aminicenantes bacterium]|jgi:hypothetical protein